jgi:hypothetical protein
LIRRRTGEARAPLAKRIGVPSGVWGSSCGDRADRAFADAGRRQFGAVQQHDVDFLGCVGDVEDRVRKPIDADDLGGVEGDFFRQGAAGALDDIALNAAPQPIGVDDQTTIMCYREFARLHLAAVAVDVDLGDDRDDRISALRIGNAAPCQRIAIAVGVWRRARLPVGALGGGLDHGNVARGLQIAQPKGDWVRTYRGGDLVDKGFASEHSKQVGQFLSCNAGLAQDRSQRAALEIPIVVRNSHQQPRLFRMPKVVMAPSNVMHNKAGALQGSDELA